LDVFGCRSFGDTKHVVDRHDADQNSGRVGHGQRGTIPFKDTDRCLLIVGRFERHKLVIKQVQAGCNSEVYP
jgi:hypothetical protein